MNQYLPLKSWAETSAPYPVPFGYLDSLGSILLGDDELLLASHYYPIVVRLDGDRAQVMALIDSQFLTRPLLDTDGRWLGAFMPTALRCFPFRLAGNSSENHLEALEVARLKPSRPDDRRIPLVDLEGRPSTEISAVHNALKRVEEGQARMTNYVDQLLIAQLLVPLTSTANSKRADQYYTIESTRHSQSTNRALEAMARHTFGAVELKSVMLFSQRHLKSELRPQVATAADVAVAAPDADQQFAHLFNAAAPWLDTSELYSSDWAPNASA